MFPRYAIHRCLFHARPRGYWAIMLHFGFHGCHHKFPADAARLVFPPLPAAAIAALLRAAAHALLPSVSSHQRTCLPAVLSSLPLHGHISPMLCTSAAT